MNTWKKNIHTVYLTAYTSKLQSSVIYILGEGCIIGVDHHDYSMLRFGIWNCSSECGGCISTITGFCSSHAEKDLVEARIWMPRTLIYCRRNVWSFSRVSCMMLAHSHLRLNPKWTRYLLRVTFFLFFIFYFWEVLRQQVYIRKLQRTKLPIL